jgi:ribosomal protein S17
MEEKNKITKKKESKTSEANMPVLRGVRLRARGRTFQGHVTKKLPGRVTIEFQRMKKIPKYERYEKRKTKLHARTPKELEEQIQVGSLIEIGETRPISKNSIDKTRKNKKRKTRIRKNSGLGKSISTKRRPKNERRSI